MYGNRPSTGTCSLARIPECKENSQKRKLFMKRDLYLENRELDLWKEATNRDLLSRSYPKVQKELPKEKILYEKRPVLRKRDLDL